MRREQSFCAFANDHEVDLRWARKWTGSARPQASRADSGKEIELFSERYLGNDLSSVRVTDVGQAASPEEDRIGPSALLKRLGRKGVSLAKIHLSPCRRIAEIETKSKRGFLEDFDRAIDHFGPDSIARNNRDAIRLHGQGPSRAQQFIELDHEGRRKSDLPSIGWSQFDQKENVKRTRPEQNAMSDWSEGPRLASRSSAA